MTLKEGFRYLKFLDELIYQYEVYVSTTNSQDDVERATMACMSIIDEREIINNAIVETKRKLGINLDVSMDINRYRQRIISVLKPIVADNNNYTYSKETLLRLISQSTQTSRDIDVAKLTSNINYSPKFNLGDTFSDIVNMLS